MKRFETQGIVSLNARVGVPIMYTQRHMNGTHELVASQLHAFDRHVRAE